MRPPRVLNPTDNKHTIWSREYRAKRNVALLGVYINRELGERFAAKAKENKVSKASVIIKAIEEYLK